MKLFRYSQLRILCILLGFICYHIPSLSAADLKDCDITVDGIFYNITSPTTVSVTYKSYRTDGYGYKYPISGFSGDVTIPSKITYNSQVYDVTAIGECAFKESSVTSVTLPGSILSIDEQAFYDCRQLVSVSLPESVTSIGRSAFDGCTKLSSAQIPAKVKSIGIQAFANCQSLTSITIPSSTETMGAYAFYDCSGLTSVTIQEGITSIPNNAFYYCTSLPSVTIPSSVTSIGSAAFSGCSSLATINIPSSVTSVGNYAFGETAWWNNQSDGLVYAGSWAYKYKGTMPDNTQIVLKEGTTGIGDGAFLGCTGLTSITVPSSVTSIDSRTFQNCSGLTTVITNGLIHVGASAFNGCTSLTDISNVGDIGSTAFSGCTNLESVALAEGATSIGSYAFSGCSSLAAISIVEGVTKIGEYAFNNCSALTSVSIPSTLDTYNDYNAFYGCNNISSVTLNCQIVGSWFSGKASIKEVVLGDKVTEIGGQAFRDCRGLTSIVIPHSVKSIGWHAFWGCSNLAEISITDGVESVGSQAFENTAWFNAQPDGLIYIGKAAYKYKGTMPDNTAIVLKEGTKSLSHLAFYGCKGLVSLTIPESVTNIVLNDGSSTFQDCTELASIKIDEGNPVYDSREGCNAIIESETNSMLFGCKRSFIPSSVTSISYLAFSGCTGLTAITIPSSVTSIGSSAFSNCDKLTSVTVKMETPLKIDSWTFSSRKYATLYVPQGSKAAYEAADYWKEFKEIVETGEGPAKCATPVISYVGGKLKFSCETEGVQFASTITDDDIKSYDTDEIDLCLTYTVSVYATKEGCEKSDVATGILCWIEQQPTTDGIMDEDAIMEVKALPVLIQAQGGTVTLRGLTEGTEVSVYGIDGKKYGSAIAEKDCATIATALPAGSVAVVKIGKRAVKVMVK